MRLTSGERSEERPRYLQPFLLVVRRDQAELARLMEALGRTGGIVAVVDRRHHERRTRQVLREAPSRRRKERRLRTWVTAVLAAEGAVLVRV